MSLVTLGSVFEHTQIEDPDLARQIPGFGDQAEAAMRRVLTYKRGSRVTSYQLTGREQGDLYEDVINLQTLEKSPKRYTQADKDLLVKAETLWAFGEAIPTLGLRQADDGGFVQSTGFDQSQTNYKRADELFEFAQDRKSQARSLARRLKPNTQRQPTWVL